MRTAWLAFVTVILLAGPSGGLAAGPYSPVLTINGNVITQHDVEQRILLLEALGAQGDVDELAMTQLTEDQLKIDAAESLGLELPEDAILAGVEEFGAARGMTLDDVFNILDERGIDRQAMNDFVESGLVWREIIGARFRDRATPTEEEVDAALAAARNRLVDVYYLGEIALPYEERGESATIELATQLAEELRQGANFEAAARQFSRSSSARNGGAIDPVPAASMPPAMRARIEGLEPGQNTGPVPISGGLAIIKLIDVKKERPQEDPTVTEFDRREAIRLQLFSERIEAYGEGYLQELEADALIQRP